MAGFIYDRYGFRCEVTAEAIELRAWRPFGRSQKTFIRLTDVQQVFVKWTGLVSIITRAAGVSVGSGQVLVTSPKPSAMLPQQQART